MNKRSTGGTVAGSEVETALNSKPAEHTLSLCRTLHHSKRENPLFLLIHATLIEQHTEVSGEIFKYWLLQ